MGVFHVFSNCINTTKLRKAFSFKVEAGYAYKHYDYEKKTRWMDIVIKSNNAVTEIQNLVKENLKYIACSIAKMIFVSRHRLLLVITQDH